MQVMSFGDVVRFLNAETLFNSTSLDQLNNKGKGIYVSK